ncbi:MAG: hypothetical protein FWJ61_11085 [Limnochordales bacterium]
MFEHMERLKLQFLSVFEGLHRKGVLSEDELAEMIDLVDRLDELSEEEIRARLGRFIEEAGDAADL